MVPASNISESASLPLSPCEISPVVPRISVLQRDLSSVAADEPTTIQKISVIADIHGRV